MRRSDGEESGGGARKERRKEKDKGRNSSHAEIMYAALTLDSFFRIFCSPSHWSKYSRLLRNKKDKYSK